MAGPLWESTWPSVSWISPSASSWSSGREQNALVPSLRFSVFLWSQPRRQTYADETSTTAAIEDWVLSNVKKAIPESVQQTWHDYRASLKKAEKEELGDNHVSKDVEKAGWGVDKAQESYQADASKSTRSPSSPVLLFLSRHDKVGLGLELRLFRPWLEVLDIISTASTSKLGLDTNVPP